MNNNKGYKSLPFFQQTEIIYDFTVEFCQKYIDPKSRLKDQMTQAARSGKQNIAEGYLIKSIESRLKLLSVARGSLNDYKSYIRQPHQAANAMVCLINQTNLLLDRKLCWLEERFVKEGGFRENLFRKRMDYKKNFSS